VDGIQEFFLIINQPKDQKVPCVSVRLDTGHLTTTPIKEYDRDKKDIYAKMFPPGPPPKRDDPRSNRIGTYRVPIFMTRGYPGIVIGWGYFVLYEMTYRQVDEYNPPFSDYVIDVSNNGGFKDNHDPVGESHVSVSSDETQLVVTGSPRRTFYYFDHTKLNDDELSEIPYSRGGLGHTNPTYPRNDAKIRWERRIEEWITQNSYRDRPIVDSLISLGARFVSDVLGSIFGTGSPPPVPNTSEVKRELEIYLRSREKITPVGDKSELFLTTRGLQCCEQRDISWNVSPTIATTDTYVRAMIGLEQTVVLLLGKEEFGLESNVLVLSFIASFGIVKAILNLFAGNLSDRWNRKKVLILGWLFGMPVHLILLFAPSWDWILVANVMLVLSII